MTEIPTRPIADASAWTGAELRKDRSWERPLTGAERAALEAGLAAAKATGRELNAITREDFAAGGALDALLSEIDFALRDGRGFIVLRGLPVQGLSDDDVRMMYLGFGRQLGTPVSQDATSVLIADVKERHQPRAPGTRVYGGKGRAFLHVDLSDVVGLLGVRQAVGGPLSTLGSAATLFNAVLAEHPEWLPRLFEGYHWDRMSEQAEWETPFNPIKTPVFSYADGRLSSRYHRGWIRAGAVRRGEPLSDEENAMFDFMDAVGDANALAFPMGPGDLYLASNYTVCHGREAYDEEPDWDTASKRLFLRLWLNLPDFRPFADEMAMRFGVISHGNLGWTSGELAAGKNRDPQARRVYLEPA